MKIKIKMKKIISIVLVLLILFSNSPLSLAMGKDSFDENTKESNSIVTTNTQEIKKGSLDEKKSESNSLDEFIQLEKSLSGNKKITIEGLRKDFSELEGEIQLEVKELNPNNGKDKEQIEIIETEMEKFIPEKSDSIKINWHHYDISILLDGEEIEPVNKLRVSFSGFDTTDLDDATKEVKVLHLNELTNEVEDKEIEIGENGVIEAEFDSFSPVTVVKVIADHPSTLKETDFVYDVKHYIEYAPGSLGKAVIDSSQILNPGRTSDAFGNIVLEHGQVITKKTATPVKGKVNTWDITVRVEGRDNIPDTTDVVLVLDNSYSMYNYKLADGRTRFQVAQEAAKKFVDIALNENPNLRIAIVVYNGEVTIISGDIKQPFSQDKQALYSNIDAIKKPPLHNPEKKGGTFTQAAIKQAGEILKGSSADNKHMVLVTDGLPTFSYDLDSSSWDEKIEQTELYYKPGGQDLYEKTKYYRLPKDESKIQFNYNNRVGLGTENMSSAAYKTLKVNKKIQNVYLYNYGEYKTGTKDPNNIDLTVQAHRYHVDGENFAREYRYSHQKSTVLEAKRLREDPNIGLDTLYVVGVGFETYTGQALKIAVRTLSEIADSGKFYDVRNEERLTDTFKEIAKTISIKIKSAMRDFKIVDIMGKGFTVTDESKIKVSEGKISFDRNSETINWDIGTVTKSVAAKSDVRYAELTYRIEINDDILTLPGAKTNQHEKFITNAVTDLTYTDIKDEKKTVSIDSPKVDPVLLKVKKVLLDINGKLLNEDITFTINVTNDLKTYDESHVLSPNEDYKWRTTLRDEGTYSVDEIATPEKNYITTIKIDGEETSKFLVNHEGDIPRGDVNIEVINQELGGYELPTTGGSGNTIFRLTGLLVLAIALIIPYRKRQFRMRKVNKFFLFGTICILAGLVLFSKNLWEDYQVGKETEIIKERLEEKKVTKIEKPIDDRPDYVKNPYMEMPKTTIDGNDYIGYVIIPSLELELPVLSSWSYPKLKIAPARYEGSVYLNNMILLAHNYKAHFGKLHRLNIGDIIQFKDMNDNLFDFTVEKKEELDEIQVEEMVSGDWDLTLFTCTLSGEARTTIRCKRIEK